MSSASSLNRHTGHFDGHLRCIAIRHGWTRSFSITPAELEGLDYDSLARILELATLKLRSTNLRIFVESPPNSGTFSKVRYWKDDGSLQSVLIKQFFQQRLDEDAVLRFEIRDGRERRLGSWDTDDVTSNGHDGPMLNKKRSAFSLAWLAGGRNASRPRVHRTDTDQTDPELGMSSPSQNRFVRFISSLLAPRSKRPPRGYTHRLPDDDMATPLHTAPSAHAAANERSALLRASTKPSLRQKLIYAAYNHGPFFSSGGPRRSLPNKDLPAVHFQAAPLVKTYSAVSRGPSSQSTPVEEVSMWEADSTANEDFGGREAPAGLITAFWRSFWGPAPRPKSTSATDADKEAMVKAQKLKRVSKQTRRKSSRAAAEEHFKGAHVIRRPEEAFPKRADSATEPRTDSTPRVAAEDTAVDPFRG